jgi:hypothetical protein
MPVPAVFTFEKAVMKKIGFLSFGHWSNHPAYKTRTASDTLLQSIDLAVAAEEIGIDGAYFRVHHFAAQLASPFPLLSAIGAKTSRIEIGTGVIDMRYENPLYMAEEAGAADLISGRRLQLGISRGSPEQVVDGWRYFGYEPAKGETDEDMGRKKALQFLDKLKGTGFAEPNPTPMFPNPPGLLRLEPLLAGTSGADLVGRSFKCYRRLGGRKRDAPPEFHLEIRRKRQAFPCTTGRADQIVQSSLEKGGSSPRAKSFGEPVDICPDK